MIRRVLISILSAMACTIAVAQTPDSVKVSRIDSALVYYTAAIESMDVSVKNQETDFLISSTSDSLLTRHIALWLWDHYKNSRLMGDEEVAIHIYDSWFKPGLIEMRSDFDRMDADIFATFNRSTLLGREAPRIELLNRRGRRVVMPADGTFSIIFFYKTTCAKCKLEAAVLPSVLSKVDFPCTVYAVYTGTDAREWRKFRRSFRLRGCHVGLQHLWDPQEDSDYTRLYGVVSTPKLYVTDTDGVVIGRRLEVESLAEIINYICISYGQKED